MHKNLGLRPCGLGLEGAGFGLALSVDTLASKVQALDWP